MSGTLSTLPTFATSPNTCGVMGLLQTGTIFSTDIINSASNLISVLSNLTTQIQNIPTNILTELSGFDQTGMVTALQTMKTVTVPAFVMHLTMQIDDLIPNLSIASTALSAHLGLINSGCNLPTLAGSGATAANPFPAMQVFFASMLGSGADLIGTVASNTNLAIAAVQALLTASMGQLQGIADSITAYVQYIVSAGVGMTTLVTSENAAFVSVATDMLNFASTTTILTLYMNPCAALVINAVASPALLSFLGGQLS
jgi:hypothetical protein